jgi:membrane protease YdiL (CAAX protease family)
MVGFVVACTAIVAVACWLRPGLPWLPMRPLGVVLRYVPFLLAWTPLLVGYLAVARAAGVAVTPQAALPYLAAGDWCQPGFWLVVGGTCVAAPLAEEIVFRGYLQPALLASLSPARAIALTAALFGLVHTLPYALPVGLLGAFFGWLAWRGGSLWPAVLAHMLHNVTTVFVTVCWPGSLDLLYPR